MNTETIALTRRACATPNCHRTVPFEGHRFCESCAAVVLRTGQPPVLVEPILVKLAREHKLPAKVLRTDGIAA